MTSQPSAADIICGLIEELGTEIDLHYEDDELPAAIPAMMKMEQAAAWLGANSIDVPPIYKHLLDRYARITH